MIILPLERLGFEAKCCREVLEPQMVRSEEKVLNALSLWRDLDRTCGDKVLIGVCSILAGRAIARCRTISRTR